MAEFAKRVALVSGANRGIGAAVAERLLDAGYSLSLGIRQPADIQRVERRADPERVHVFRYDAAQRDSGKSWIAAAAARFGRIDAVVNAAGILRPFDFESDDESALDDLLEVNLKGPMRVMRHAFPHLKQAGAGRIVNIVSLSGLRVKGRSAGYAISKFALNALTQSARLAGWEHGIRVTSLCPGFVNTDMVAHVDSIAQEQMIQTETIAEIVHLLVTLPNTASIATLPVNCVLEEIY